ncbi:MAG: exodeoxyribonuclease V subunit alpha [Chlamydiota bacterium]
MSLLQKLHQQHYFSTLSTIFTQTLTKTDDEDILILLSYLFDQSMQGHLAIQIEEGNIQPRAQTLLTEEIRLEEDLLQEIEKRVYLGFTKMPESLIQDGSLETSSIEKPLCRWKNYLYLQKHFVIETQFLSLLKKHTKKIPVEEEKTISSSFLEKKNLSLEQKQAIYNSFSYSLSIISGGPGTGKTFTAIHLVETFIETFSSNKPLRIILTAPTGKAAFHLHEKLLQTIPCKENVTIEAMTLHSLLTIRENEENFSAKSLIEADLILVDEASMIDGMLFFSFLLAKKPSTFCVLLGDENQLPPVGMGSFFRDLVFLGTDQFVSHLSIPYRFEKKELIWAAEKIKEGKAAAIEFLMQPSLENIVFRDFTKVEEEIDRFIQQWYKKGQFFEGKILSCLRKGPYGVNALNQKIFSYLGEGKKERRVPILITKNAPSLDLYNGSMGELQGNWEGNKFSIHTEAYFPHKKETMPLFSLPSYEYGYVLSVHKAQGSEFPEVLLLIPPGSESFGREILYTAITRAQKHVTIVGHKETMVKMLAVSNEKKSALRERFFSTSGQT